MRIGYWHGYQNGLDTDIESLSSFEEFIIGTKTWLRTRIYIIYNIYNMCHGFYYFLPIDNKANNLLVQ